MTPTKQDDDRELTRRIAWDYIHEMVERLKALEKRVALIELQLLGKKDGKSQ